ncbi:Holliday junction branch migration protein RuvA [Lacticaseibacillus nasuensis]|uniref:Holliday junction branch migration protein RuvA n=1 Tax=Lacticaseibacillus nasuensis TaxID=944671 RepID=UPI00224810C2|nr:Holliday junction branch migration protein RuvA [Lacticaseibacillus nasuensis]MCX2454444.1 Holliday junction branch migration protein RuvA [Lacticaseibacillus nasuensis]
MYEYLNGTIASVTPSCIVVDVGGVGYRVLTANPYHFTVGETTRVYVQQIIRDTEQSLYGFATEEDKATFNQLLTVTGIGPKSALAILANADPAGLASAVAADDVTFLTKFPGVGKKTAQQIILDLKGKLAVGAAEVVPAAAPSMAPALADALAALTALGYAERDVAKVGKALAKAPATTTEAYLSQGLALLTK